MTCIKCGAEIAEGSAFCNRCGASLQAPQASPRPPESELWKGRYSGRSMALSFLGLFALALAIVLVLVLKPELPGWATIGLAAGWALLGAVLLCRLLYEKFSIRYRLTTERLFFERGVLTRRVTELELLRVDDVSFSQNLLERFFNVGTVAIASTDSDTPSLLLEGIPEPEAVKEQIRNQVRTLRQGVVNVQRV